MAILNLSSLIRFTMYKMIASARPYFLVKGGGVILKKSHFQLKEKPLDIFVGKNEHFEEQFILKALIKYDLSFLI